MGATLFEVPVRMTQTARRALVVDDHPIVKGATAGAIKGLFENVDTAGSLAEARRALEVNAQCSLAVLDLHLTDAEGRDTLAGLRESFPDVPVLIFSGDNALETITMAFECGARGYVTKGSEVEILINAARLVVSGGSYIPPEAAQMLGFQAPQPVTGITMPAPVPQLALSGRQQQVFRLLLQGMPNKVIGSRLNMAEGTVKAHLNTVYRMLGVRTRVEAILRARQLGLL